MVVAKAVKVVLDVKVTEDLDVTEVMKIVKVLEALNIVKSVEAVEVEETGRPGVSMQTAQLVQAEAMGGQAEAAAAAVGAPENIAELTEGTVRKERKRKKSRKARKDERLAAVMERGKEAGVIPQAAALQEEQPVRPAEEKQTGKAARDQEAILTVQSAESKKKRALPAEQPANLVRQEAIQTVKPIQNAKRSHAVQAKDPRGALPVSTLLSVKIIQDLQSLKGRERTEGLLGIQAQDRPRTHQLSLAAKGIQELLDGRRMPEARAQMLGPVMDTAKSRRGTAAAQEREGTSKRIREFLAGAKGMEALRAPPQAAAVPLF
ncbi:hypothetical protein ACP26L_34095 [Paenibacillus sp. S-38]|uniref:hypothetical protein n=1 Tax=Paenibacillus sp. S-38 TaxID=3416710 RepID=UPI003CE75FC1